MKNLRFYETDAAFKAYEQGAGGDGNSTKTSIPGVSGTWDLGKTYFNPHDEAKLTHTVTVKYVSIFDGTELADSETIEIKYLSGVTQEFILISKLIDGYVAIDDKVIVHIPSDVEVKIPYKNIINSENPLIFDIISAGTIVLEASDIAHTRTIEYKLNDGEWTSITSYTGASAPSISVSDGDVVYFRGDNAAYGGYLLNHYYYNSFSGSTAKFEVEGNIMSLIDSTGFATDTTLASSYTFYNLFYQCASLTSAENLILPATTLTNYCYNSMFYGCTSLTTAPALPATTLASSCYNSMFYNCTSLTTAQELPATTLTNECYREMFRGCTSLTTAPELPATTLASSCYNSMFSGCTSLTSAPVLPATNLASYCYSSMFYNCTSLTTAPELPATTLASVCYQGMFSNCTSLTSAPELPATTLESYCYALMFRGCTSLTTAPELPATALASNCYRGMFSGCTSLNYIKCLATDISASNCTYNWVGSVASSGTFVKNPNMSNWTTGDDGIPNNWTVQDA